MCNSFGAYTVHVLVVPVDFGDQAVRYTLPVLFFEYDTQLGLRLFATLWSFSQIEQVDARVVRGRHHGFQLLFVYSRVERGPRGQTDVGHP